MEVTRRCVATIKDYSFDARDMLSAAKGIWSIAMQGDATVFEPAYWGVRFMRATHVPPEGLLILGDGAAKEKNKAAPRVRAEGKAAPRKRGGADAEERGDGKKRKTGEQPDDAASNPEQLS